MTSPKDLLSRKLMVTCVMDSRRVACLRAEAVMEPMDKVNNLRKPAIK